VFSLFKKKPKLNNEANQDLSLMLFDNPDDPVRGHNFFHNKSMDFTIESLEILDEYLESLRPELPENDELVKITLRAGSYIGEVVRKNSAIKYNWLEFKEAEKLNPQITGLGFGLGTTAILWAEPDNFVFPLAKVLKRLENGSEDNVHFFAKVAIDGLPR
jgi:hypothetical protein